MAGVLEFFSGAVSSGTTAINGGGTLEIGSGYTVSGFVVSSGQTLEIASGGSASNTTVDSGGTLDILSGGSATGTTNNGGSVNSGSSSGTTVTSGEIYTVSSGQTDSGDVVLSGGTEIVASGGTVNGVTISSGGILERLGGRDGHQQDMAPRLVRRDQASGYVASNNLSSEGVTGIVLAGASTARAAARFSAGLLHSSRPAAWLTPLQSMAR